jgi:hypothetical protein
VRIFIGFPHIVNLLLSCTYFNRETKQERTLSYLSSAAPTLGSRALHSDGSIATITICARFVLLLLPQPQQQNDHGQPFESRQLENLLGLGIVLQR